ncbi:D-3-phosphoglycerate dehydrogenase/(S)-sulfolactate dehydrogenase [Bacillus sp. OV194]|nr:D-3-phosphoglycerate dehydrogenase/(S)-sulfolactate dehydrogenase [Bacillus sp. OV194]
MKVLITELIWDEGKNLLEGFADVHYDPELWRKPEVLLSMAKSADALIVRNQTKVDEELLNQCENLKVVGRLGVGLDNIDIPAARKQSIQVVYARNANAISVAEYVMTAILSLNRELKLADHSVKQLEWNRRLFTGTEIYGKTIGLIGVGEIAHRIAKRASSFGMKVVGYDPFVMDYDFQAAESGIELLNLEQVLPIADYISIHVPLVPGTKNLFGKDEFRKMKPSSCLINTSRGGIINESDLSWALDTGEIGCAVLDVLEQEPPQKEHPLLFNKQVILTPHVAGLTEESQVRTSVLVASEVIKVLNKEQPLCTV